MRKGFHLAAWLAVILGAGLCKSGPATGQDSPSDERTRKVSPIELNLNIPTPTLGGRQFWADAYYFHEWRIQQNLFTKHYRLLDGNDIRLAWGTLEQCRERLRQIREEKKVPRMSDEAVILVHGIGLSSKSFSAMRTHLRENGFPFVFGFDYPSTRVDIQTSADYLKRAVDSLEEIEKVHFVTHSLGGLIVREYLSKHKEPRAGRLVMLGTPNQGANLADLFRINPLYMVLLGPAGQQLGANSQSFVWKLPRPRCEFAVIAGGRGTELGYNPLIPGDDDTMVSVQSVFLEGAADSLVVPVPHIDLPRDASVREYVTRFLREGRLREDGERQPVIPAVAKRAEKAGRTSVNRNEIRTAGGEK